MRGQNETASARLAVGKLPGPAVSGAGCEPGAHGRPTPMGLAPSTQAARAWPWSPAFPARHSRRKTPS